MANQTRLFPRMEDRFPIGTTVQLFKFSDVFKDGATSTSGTAVASATVAADGSLTFTNVPSDAGHMVMVATVAGRSLSVVTGGDGTVSWAARH